MKAGELPGASGGEVLASFGALLGVPGKPLGAGGGVRGAGRSVGGALGEIWGALGTSFGGSEDNFQAILKLVFGLVSRADEHISAGFGLRPTAAGVNGRFKALRQGRQHWFSRRHSFRHGMTKGTFRSGGKSFWELWGAHFDALETILANVVIDF